MQNELADVEARLAFKIGEVQRFSLIRRNKKKRPTVVAFLMRTHGSAINRFEYSRPNLEWFGAVVLRPQIASLGFESCR